MIVKYNSSSEIKCRSNQIYVGYILVYACEQTLWIPVVELTQVLFDPNLRDFIDPKGKTLSNLTFLGEIFLTQTINGLTQPGSKNFDPVP